MGNVQKCQKPDIHSYGWCVFSNEVVGYIYTIAWGMSFLGQIGLNYKLKNVEGCNLDFVTYNVTGFSFYAIYNIAGYWWPYKGQQDPGSGIGGVETNDIVFALWAWSMAVITLIQCFFFYPKGKNKVSRLCWIMTGVYWFIGVLYTMLTDIPHLGKGAIKPHRLINALFMLSYIKLFISLTKYIPQAYWNFLRKSTVGWKGDNPFSKSTNGSAGVNVAKFGLSIISILFDILFMIQHYVLYNPKNKPVVPLIFDPNEYHIEEPLQAKPSDNNTQMSMQQITTQDGSQNNHYEY